jgi:hypothetical protein
MNNIMDENLTYEYFFLKKLIFRKFILEVTNIIFPK